MPSACNTKKKLKNTSALPGSGCGKMSRAGSNMRISATRRCLRLFRSVLISLICLVMASAAITFANSAGCKLNPPKPYQDLAPDTSVPNTNKPSNKAIITRYAILENRSNILTGLNCINNIKVRLRIAKNNCLPKACWSENIVTSGLWLVE